LKTLAVIFACNTEHTLVQYCMHYVLTKNRCFVCAVLESALSSTCFEFC